MYMPGIKRKVPTSPTSSETSTIVAPSPTGSDTSTIVAFTPPPQKTRRVIYRTSLPFSIDNRTSYAPETPTVVSGSPTVNADDLPENSAPFGTPVQPDKRQHEYSPKPAGGKVTRKRRRRRRRTYKRSRKTV